MLNNLQDLGTGGQLKKTLLFICCLFFLCGCSEIIKRIFIIGHSEPFYIPRFDISSSLFDLSNDNNVYFSLFQENIESICKLDLKTRMISQLTDGYHDNHPVLTDDGRTLFFLRSGQEYFSMVSIYKINTDGSGLKKVYDNAQINIEDMTYNSINNHIYFVGGALFNDINDASKSSHNFYDIFSLNLDTQKVKRLTHLGVHQIDNLILSRDKNKLYIHLKNDKIDNYSDYTSDFRNIRSSITTGFYELNLASGHLDSILFNKSDDILNSDFERCNPEILSVHQQREYDDFIYAMDGIRSYKVDFENRYLSVFTDKVNGKSLILAPIFRQMWSLQRINQSKRYIGLTKKKGKLIFVIYNEESGYIEHEIIPDKTNFVPLKSENYKK